MGDNNEMTMEEYMEKTLHVIKELKDTPFGGTNEEDANEYVEKVLEISEMFNLLSVSKDQIMLTIFPKTVIEAAKRWIKSEPSGIITTWNYLKSKFLAKYCPLFKTTRQIKEIHNIKQEVDETSYRAWERLKGLASITTKLDKLGREVSKRHAAVDVMLMKYNAETKAAMKNHAASIKNSEKHINHLMRVVEARLNGSSTGRTGKVQVNTIDIKFNGANPFKILPYSGLSSVGQVQRVMAMKKSLAQDLPVVKPYVEPYVPSLPFLERKLIDDKECR
ncbi:retrotransposon protein [Tanacetum coccineum]